MQSIFGKLFNCPEKVLYSRKPIVNQLKKLCRILTFLVICLSISIEDLQASPLKQRFRRHKETPEDFSADNVYANQNDILWTFSFKLALSTIIAATGGFAAKIWTTLSFIICGGMVTATWRKNHKSFQICGVTGLWMTKLSVLGWNKRNKA